MSDLQTESSREGDYKELMLLVQFAEESFERTSKYSLMLFKIRLFVIIPMMVFLGGFGFFLFIKSESLLTNPLYQFAFIMLFISNLILFYFLYFRMTKIRRTLAIEARTLRKLLDMIHDMLNLSRQNNNNEQFSLIERALLEMRLSRIDFSGRY